MGNFDFFSSSPDDFKNDLKDEMKRRFIEVETLAKIDIYSSAYKLRNLWTYVFTKRLTKEKYTYTNDKGKEVIAFYTGLQNLFSDEKENSDNEKEDSSDQSQKDRNNLVTDEKINSTQLKGYLSKQSGDTLDALKGMVGEKERYPSIGSYIQEVGNSGAHESGYISDSNALHRFVHDLTFEKLVLGIELSRYLLRKFFIQNFDSLKPEEKKKKFDAFFKLYDIGNMSIGRYEVVPERPDESDKTPKKVENDALTPRYIIGKHEYYDRGRELSLYEYALIKEYRLFENEYNAQAADELENKFTMMAERKNYLTALLGTGSAAVSFRGTIKTPFRYITYSIPINCKSFEDGKTIKRIDKLFEGRNVQLNIDFFCELAKIFYALEKRVNTILIRGVSMENIWVYKVKDSYHPMFTGYDLCTIKSEKTNKREEQINTLTQEIAKRYNQNLTYSIVLAKINNNESKKDFLGSFFTLVFNIYCRSFKDMDVPLPEGQPTPASLEERLDKTDPNEYFTKMYDTYADINKNLPAQLRLEPVQKYLEKTLEELKYASSGSTSKYAKLSYTSAEEIYNAFISKDAGSKGQTVQPNKKSKNRSKNKETQGAPNTADGKGSEINTKSEKTAPESQVSENALKEPIENKVATQYSDNAADNPDNGDSKQKEESASKETSVRRGKKLFGLFGK